MRAAAAVTVDARCLTGGIATYAFHLVRELGRLNSPLHVQVLTTRAGTGTFASYCDEVKVLNAPLFSAREQFALAAAARDRLLHCTHYNAPLLRRAPLVVTIPDVTPLLDCNYHNSRKSRHFAAFALQAIARRADHIITVSHYSRARIIEKLHVPAARISVAYNGVSGAFRPMERDVAESICHQRLSMREPFLLYVGNLRLHKNVPMLLHAYQRCRRLYRIEQHLVLIATGTPQAVLSLRRLAADLGIADFVHLVGFVDEATLVAAYNAADAVVIPSLEEGFCLPVLESMACGTPVACSDASALPEIAGDAAAYFDPVNPESMAETIQAVLENAELRRQMRSRGLARAARYTWTESAQIHLGVYSQFVDSSVALQACNQSGRNGSERVVAEDAPTPHL